ncbi:MAG: hypothetical protein ACOX8S_05585 [Christensenellales bacterium]|jgi:hypothetical protein
MKKALVLLVVLAILAMPVFAMAAPGGPGDNDAKAGEVSITSTSFYMLPEDAEVEEDAEVDLPPIVIPAAGAVVATGVVMILATMGVALLPKK